jgi:mono/diheme cytochrome c family protein
MRVLIGVLVALVFDTAPVRAEPPGDPGRGHDLARQLCSSCHLVSPEQRGPVPHGIPSLMAIAVRPGVTEGHLLGVLVSPPRPPMPAPPFSRQQMRDVVAYILSLRPP